MMARKTLPLRMCGLAPQDMAGQVAPRAVSLDYCDTNEILIALLALAPLAHARWPEDTLTPPVAAACQQAGQYQGGEGTTVWLPLGPHIWPRAAAAWQQAGQYAGGTWIYSTDGKGLTKSKMLTREENEAVTALIHLGVPLYEINPTVVDAFLHQVHP